MKEGRRPGPKYLALIRKFPLRPIRSEEENETALAVLASLAERREREPLEAEEFDYIAVLGKLVEEYEDTRYPRGPVSGAAMLAHLIEAQGISQAMLAADTGIAESTVSELLKQKRGLTRRHIEVFARYFRVEPAVFLRSWRDVRDDYKKQA
jgi:HTH-type transcriptional regulator / antitoxin HigA